MDIVAALPRTIKATKNEILEFKLDKEVTLIVDASVRAESTFMTRCKALLIYHHFRRCVDETKYDPYLVAISCLDLSAKYNEEDIQLDDILMGFCSSLGGIHPRDEKFQRIKKSVTIMECVIMRILEFSLSHRLAHEYSFYFLNDLQELLSELGVWNQVSETCIRIMCDIYLSNRCLNYKAKEIAAAAVETSVYITGIMIHNKNCFLNSWTKNLSVDSKMLDIVEDIFRICNVGPVAQRLANE